MDLIPPQESAVRSALDRLGAAAASETQWVVQVPMVIPGETVLARIYRNKNSYSEADVIRVLEASPERMEPQCKLFGACGGCQYQHMGLDLQREWKRRQRMNPGSIGIVEIKTKASRRRFQPLFDCTPQVEDLLLRNEKISFGAGVLVESPVCTEHGYNYRSKLTPHFDKPKIKVAEAEKSGEGERVKVLRAIGFKERTSQNILDVEECPIATVGINAALPGVRQAAEDEAYQRYIDVSRHWRLRTAAMYLSCRVLMAAWLMVDGCDEQFLDQLIRFGPRRVVYVACDPSTQARDAKYLLGT
eukprot:scaffold3178_cov282-Pinguiococcus_pyrenoidosus.AAC.3